MFAFQDGFNRDFDEFTEHAAIGNTKPADLQALIEAVRAEIAGWRRMAL